MDSAKQALSRVERLAAIIAIAPSHSAAVTMIPSRALFACLLLWVGCEAFSPSVGSSRTVGRGAGFRASLVDGLCVMSPRGDGCWRGGEESYVAAANTGEQAPASSAIRS